VRRLCRSAVRLKVTALTDHQNPMRPTGAAPLVMAAFATSLAFGFAIASAAPAQTEVRIFRPSLPSKAETRQSGRCWTESIAVNRPVAWRCMHENMIYDPCFEVAGRSQQVVCGASPVAHKDGFLLPTQPLPVRPAANATPQPWLIELADGSVCEAATGTMAVIDGEPVRYPCTVSSSRKSGTDKVYCGLLSKLHPAKIWMADEVCIIAAPSDRGPPFKLQKRETVVVRRVWE
jgi:hypothetical protein